MWLLWHTKTFFSNKLLSTNSSEAGLGEKRSQSTSHLEKTKAASRETRQFCIYDQLRKEDPRTFQKSSAIQINHMMKYSIRPVTVSGNNISETGSP